MIEAMFAEPNPASIKAALAREGWIANELRAYNGLGYANDMLFVFNENEGEFGTYYGLKILK